MLVPSKYEEKYLRNIFKSGTLKDLKVYQVNESYFELDDGEVIIVDGGIQMTFPKGIFCIGWSSELDLFVFHKGQFESIYEQDNFVAIKNEKLQDLIGDAIKNVNFKVLDFDVITDYTMRTEKEKRFVEVKLEFNSGKILRLSLIDYDTETGKAPFNYNYDISNELLIALNEEIEIL